MGRPVGPNGQGRGVSGEGPQNSGDQEQTMRNILFFAAALSLIVVLNEADGAEWKYFGGSTATGELVRFYYDAGSVQPTTAPGIQVWTKVVKQGEIEGILTREEDQIIAATVEAYAGGYQPPYLSTVAVFNRDKHLEVIAWERAANRPGVLSQAKLLYEVDCTENKIRMLSVVSYAKDGTEVRSGSDAKAPWKDIVPEGNAERLGKMLCRGGVPR
jgi:hypothetical protein